MFRFICEFLTAVICFCLKQNIEQTEINQIMSFSTTKKAIGSVSSDHNGNTESLIYVNRYKF